MARLLKAEWYRFWRSSHLWIWYVVFLAETVMFSVWEFGDDSEFVTFTEKIFHETDMSASSIYFILPVITAVSVALLYHNKTGYYQVMSGHRVSHILLSKMLIDGMFLSLVWAAGLISYYVYYGVVHGVDGLDQIPLRIFLIVLAVLRVGMSGALLAEIIEHPAAGVLAFVRLVFAEGLYALSVNAFVYEPVWNGRLLNLSATRYVIVPITAPEELAASGFELSTLLIPGILTCLMEIVFWYIIAYIKMKRKAYKC